MSVQAARNNHVEASEKLDDLRERLGETQDDISVLSQEIADLMADGLAGTDEVEELRRERNRLKELESDLEAAIDQAEIRLGTAKERLWAAEFEDADREAASAAGEAAEIGQEALRAALEAVDAYRRWKELEEAADRRHSAANDLYQKLREPNYIDAPDPIHPATGYSGNPLTRGHQRARIRLDLHQNEARRKMMQQLEKISRKADLTRKQYAADHIREPLGLSPDGDSPQEDS